EARKVPNLSPDALHRNEHGTLKLGVGGSGSTGGYNKTKTNGKNEKSASFGFEVAGKYGASAGSIDWVDVNGDGLPDLVKRQANQGGAFMVRLNYGYRLGNEIHWPASQWSQSDSQYSEPIAGLFPSGFNGLFDFPQSYIGLNGVRAEDNTSFSG